MLTIALDYDKTYTADPDLWRRFVADAQRAGHLVVCVTGRRAMPDYSREPRLPDGVPVVLAGQAWKRDAAARAGYSVSIWIDDMPGMIEPARILDFSEPAASQR